MPLQTVRTDQAPAAIGPYSQGVICGRLLFTAMQIALDAGTGTLVGGCAAEQAQRCLENIRAIVEAAGGKLETVVKTTVYLVDIAAFGEVNEVYGRFFTAEPPARGVVQVGALPRGALVAVEAIAEVPGS